MNSHWPALLGLLLLGGGVAWADTVQRVEVVVVANSQTATEAEAIANRAEALAKSYGLDTGQLTVRRYDFDTAQEHCVNDLHIASSELPYVGVVEIGSDGSERSVLFHIDNAADIEKDSQAAVRTARGLVGGGASIRPAAPEDPETARQLDAYYHRLLATPTALGFHPDAGKVGQVMDFIRTRYVDPISDPEMEAGIVHQVHFLLQAAGQSTDALDHMALDLDLPSHIDQIYPDVPSDLLGWAEIQGVLEPLDDPHSSLLTPDQAKRLNNTLEETSFAGIGIHIDMERKAGHAVIVVDVLDDTPAAGAGLQAGDAIVKVDGISTLGMTTDLVSNLLRGAVGTPVTVSLQHGNTTRTVTMTRAAITPHSVSSRVLPGNIGYLRMHAFAANSATEVEAVLLQWKMARVGGLILDLRNNGGGYVKTAQELCSLFLPRGETVLSIVGRGGARQDIPSNGPAEYAGIPLVLLVNAYSASASELTAGCLKDHHLATLVGVRTYGKGSMQAPFDFPDKTVLKLTIAHFYSPSGTIIDHLGVPPDVVVEMDPTLIGQPGDTQLQKAVDLIQSHHNP